ncbi:DNA polymerase III subunit alpha [Peptococcaceae bacterium CEB3]|nr:DNA polymerase III subunit alpha [Peptococcaceae bacterium CEB3]
MSGLDFVHLHVHSPYSFLAGGSHLHNLVRKAKELGFGALALTDWHSLAGVARFQELMLGAGLKPIFGAEVAVRSRELVRESRQVPVAGTQYSFRADGEGGFGSRAAYDPYDPYDPGAGGQRGFTPDDRFAVGANGPCCSSLFGPRRSSKGQEGQESYHLVLLARNAEGYRNLSRLLTESHLDHPRGEPLVEWESLKKFSSGLYALSGCRQGEVPFWLLQGKYEQARASAEAYRELFDGYFYLEVQGDRLPGWKSLWMGMQRLHQELGISLVATNNVHYAAKEDFQVFDLLTCLRKKVRLDEAVAGRYLNAENYLKTPAEMLTACGERPEILEESARIAADCNVRLGEESFFPQYPLPGVEARAGFLRELTWQGARQRYGRITPEIQRRLEYELGVINQLEFADYFLVVWDALQFARRKGIRFAGRGSAADSAVAYCLKITEVDAIGRGLLFERFLSLERAEKPDIDVDFDARYRDQVAAYFSERYGRDQVAAVGTFQTFRARSAIREVGKAFGLPEAELDDLAKRMPWINADEIQAAMSFFPELKVLPPERQKNLQTLLAYCARISEFPKFLGMHLGGIVVSREPVADIVPVQWSGKGTRVIQADKRDIEELGLFKIDLLSLRTLSVVDDSIRDIQASDHTFREETTVGDHEEVYARLRTGETMGIFQLESPAQRALQSRLGAERFEDVVASVALIRPGPVKGDMVEPYVARRQGLAPVAYLHPALEAILRKTYGVVLFQEQAIEIVQKVAGFSLGEADRLRRVMSHVRSQEEMREIGRMFEKRAIERGVEKKVAETIFSYLVGYAGYGFCEAHAAAFATTALKTAYLVEHHPAEFFAALLNHQPMGFYPAHTLALEAKRRGVRLWPLDLQKSVWNFRVENGGIRTGFRQLKNMSREVASRIEQERDKQEFRTWQDAVARCGLSDPILENLVLAGAFETLFPNRKALLWEIRQGRGRGLFAEENFLGPEYPDFTLLEKTEWEYRLLKLNTTHRLMEIWRQVYAWQGFATTKTVGGLPAGARVSLIGHVLRPHRPPTRSGQVVVFFTLEDEFGFLDVTLFERDYQKCGQWLFGSRSGPRLVSGVLQRRGQGVSLIAEAVLPPPGDSRHRPGETKYLPGGTGPDTLVSQ